MAIEKPRRIAVVGAAGGIGSALVEALAESEATHAIYAMARRRPDRLPEKARWIEMDATSEESVESAAAACGAEGPLHLVIVASGILHDGESLQPEKSWRSISSEQLLRVFEVNAVAPTLVAKHFLPILSRDQRAVFAAISARVGSISDNGLGGWYAYRASKAALNMLIKSLAIELQRRNKSAVCLALHPGTVDTTLSAPFQGNVRPGKLFPPSQAAQQLLDVIGHATVAQTGTLLAWDGQEIAP